MCRSQAEGGQRCGNYALNRWQAAVKAESASPNDPKAKEALHKATVEWATTPSGAASLRKMSADVSAEYAAYLQGAIRQGQLIAERNEAVRQAAILNKVPPPVEKASDLTGRMRRAFGLKRAETESKSRIPGCPYDFDGTFTLFGREDSVTSMLLLGIPS